MDKIQKNIFSLLKSAFSGSVSDMDKLSAEEWERLYDYSKDQSVTAVCYEAITMLPDELQPPRPLLFQWAMFSKKTENAVAMQKQAVSKILQIVDTEGIRLQIIKGFSLAKHYPKPNHRFSGDVDIYCFGDSEKVDKLMEKNGAEINYSNSRHSMINVDGVKIENHRYFLYARHDAEEKELEVFLQNEAEICRKRSDKKVLFGTPIGNAVFFLKHAEKDFVFNRQNIKLRMLCDWTALLKSGEVDYEKLNHIKKGKTIDRFADVLTVVCVEKLGLSTDYLNYFPPVKKKVLDDFMKMILDYQHQVEARGTFKGKIQRLFKYIKHYKTYKYIFGKNIINWYYFSK